MWSIKVIRQNNEKVYQEYKATEKRKADKIRQCIRDGVEEYFDSFLFPCEVRSYFEVKPIIKPILRRMKEQGVL